MDLRTRCHLLLIPFWIVLIAPAVVIAQQNPYGQLPITQFHEPYLLLLRDPVVQQELKLTSEQFQQLDNWNKQTDGTLWTTRNQPAEQSTETTSKLIAASRQKMQSLLNEDQLKRLDQIELWTQGLRSLLRARVIQALSLTQNQQQKIQETMTQAQAEFESLRKRAQSGEPLEPLKEKHSELAAETQKNVQSLLKPEQLRQWAELMGAPLPVEKMGFIKFQAPELIGPGPWINSRPLKMKDLRGKVVVVHFWTFGCINCIHNYPAYHHWLEQFAGKDVVLLGIHTPELANEHDVAMIRKRAGENNLNYPILVDNDSLNWNAWGNSMWPTVYLVDKRGDVRGWWQGELNWQGQEGEKIFTKRIEELLEE